MKYRFMYRGIVWAEGTRDYEAPRDQPRSTEGKRTVFPGPRDSFGCRRVGQVQSLIRNACVALHHHPARNEQVWVRARVDEPEPELTPSCPLVSWKPKRAERGLRRCSLLRPASEALSRQKREGSSLRHACHTDKRNNHGENILIKALSICNNKVENI